MILHFLTNDKFSDYVIKHYSAVDDSSDFVLISNDHKMDHIHYPEKLHIVNPTKENEMKELIRKISSYDAVMFHGLSFWWQEWIIKNMSKDVKIAWLLWGGEIYGQPDLAESFYAPISKCIYKIRGLFHDNGVYAFPKELIKKADYCLTSEVEEVEYLNNYLHTNIPHLWYTYYALEDTIGPLINQRSHGDNIILGNSAGIANNHFDALWQLKRIGVGSREIITPLSYGAPWERRLCLKFGELLFGERFKPLVEFLPLNEYNAKMLSCSVMIQPHWRPNAHGNIITALWLGMRVYLSEHNIEYAFFKRIGCVIFSIENDLKRSNPDVYAPLSDEDVITNQSILRSVFSKQQVNDACKRIVEELCR